MQTARCFSPAGRRFSLYFGCSSSRIKASTPAARQEFSALQVLPVDLHQCPRNPSDDDAGELRNRHNRARSEDTNLAATGHSITYREPGAGGAGLPAAEPGRPLPPALLYRPCDPAELPFDLVSELEDPLGPIGQDRAVEAVQFAVAMRRKGYNVYALGASGTGKHTVIRDLLRRRAENAPTPPDWCYVNNFADPQKPRRLQLPPGRGNGLREAMKRLVEELRAALPAAFERDDYRARRDVIDQQFKQRNEQAFGELQRRGEQKGITMLRTPMGLALAPRRDGKVLTPEMFEALPEAERERIQQRPGRGAGRARSGHAEGAAMGARAPRGGARTEPQHDGCRDRADDGRAARRLLRLARCRAASRRGRARHQGERRRFSDPGATAAGNADPGPGRGSRDRGALPPLPGQRHRRQWRPARRPGDLRGQPDPSDLGRPGRVHGSLRHPRHRLQPVDARGAAPRQWRLSDARRATAARRQFRLGFAEARAQCRRDPHRNAGAAAEPGEHGLAPARADPARRQDRPARPADALLPAELARRRFQRAVQDRGRLRRPRRAHAGNDPALCALHRRGGAPRKAPSVRPRRGGARHRAGGAARRRCRSAVRRAARDRRSVAGGRPAGRRRRQDYRHGGRGAKGDRCAIPPRRPDLSPPAGGDRPQDHPHRDRRRTDRPGQRAFGDDPRRSLVRQPEPHYRPRSGSGAARSSTSSARSSSAARCIPRVC